MAFTYRCCAAFSLSRMIFCPGADCIIKATWCSYGTCQGRVPTPLHTHAFAKRDNLTCEGSASRAVKTIGEATAYTASVKRQREAEDTVP